MHRQIFSEINITPLTDIFLVLLIIMMVVAPVLQQTNQDIKPPEISAGGSIKPDRLTVEVTREGIYYVEGEVVSIEAMAEKLVAISDELGVPDEERNLIIRADRETRSGAVMSVFEAARDARFAKVTVAGEKRENTPASELPSRQQEEEVF